MMRYGRTAHVYQCGDIDDAFFAVTQKPKDPDAAPIAQLFEDIRNGLELVDAGHIFQFFFCLLSVIMGKFFFCRHR